MQLTVFVAPRAIALIHVGVIEHGAVLLPIPAGRAQACSEKDERAWRNVFAIRECVGAASGQASVKGSVGQHEVTTQHQADTALVLQEDELFFGAFSALYADYADHVGSFSLKDA